MRSLRTLVLTIVAVALIAGFSSDLNAQQRGKSRFFKKLRDDVAAASKKQAEKAKLAASKKANAKTPTIAPQYKGNKNANTRQQSANSRQPQSRQSSTRQQASIRQQQQASTRQQQQANTRANVPAIQASSQRVPTQTSNGFGWILREDNHDRLIVSKLDPNGNAAEAGIRPGDVIVEAGGVEITGKDEYESIIQIFRPGDQMDFTLESRGRDKKATIQFGQAPPAEQFDNSSRNESDNNRNSIIANVSAQQQIQLLKGTIAQQQLTIQQLREELTRLRFESKTNSVIRSRSDDFSSNTPAFNGPSINAPRR